MKILRVSILEKNEMLHALPRCLVIGMSLIVRLDPKLPSLSRLDSLSLWLGFFLFQAELFLLNRRVWDWHAYFSRGFFAT